jgi:hypothetical protein
MPVQAVIFDKNIWNILGAHQWLIHHHYYPIKSPHITKHFIRFRLNDPKQYKRIRTLKLPNGIDMLIGYY